MDERHIDELAEWVSNNIDVEAGMPVIFSDYCQVRLEQKLKGEN